MSLMYGYDPKEGDNMMAAPVEAAALLSRLMLPGAALVNHFASCRTSHCIIAMNVRLTVTLVRYIPSWVPWLSYEPLAREGRRLSKKMKNDPINFVKNSMVSSHYISMVSPALTILASPWADHAYTSVQAVR